MTTTTNTAKAAQNANTPMTKDEVKKMLRDAAFVLHMTRRVKAEILAARPEAASGNGEKNAELAAGLGV